MGNGHGAPDSDMSMQPQVVTLQPSAEYAAPIDSTTALTQRSSTNTVKELQGQIQDTEQIKANNAKGHGERMDSMANNNLKKRDARQARYDIESDAQRHRNADSKSINDSKISDLSTANQSEMAAMRVVNEAEIVEMRRQGALGQAGHDAWTHRLQTQNAQRMAKMESDGARKVRGLKMHGRGDELRHKKENSGMNTAHSVDMANIEQKHQSELTDARQNRANNLSRHNHKMTTMNVQHQHETDDLKLRQKDEVNAQGRANDAKQATQTANMKALKGKNQNAMDDLCRRMRQTEDLEAAVEVSTERFFVLADKVKNQRTGMRIYAELQILSETLLSTQTVHIRSVRKEVEVARKKCAETAQSTSSLKELRKHFKSILSAQESLRRRVSRQMDAFAKVNDKLLDKHLTF